MRTIKSLLAASMLALLSACATGNIAYTDPKGTPVEAPPADFKLKGVRVVWKDNPDLKWDLRSSLNAMTLQRVDTKSDSAIARAKTDIFLMQDLLKQFAPNDVSSNLQAQGVNTGEPQTMEIFPTRGYWSDGGWGSGIILQITITDSQSKKAWSHTVQADTGLQLTGAMAAGVQDRGYVQAFSVGLVKSLKINGFF